MSKKTENMRKQAKKTDKLKIAMLGAGGIIGTLLFTLFSSNEVVEDAAGMLR